MENGTFWFFNLYKKVPVLCEEIISVVHTKCGKHHANICCMSVYKTVGTSKNRKRTFSTLIPEKCRLPLTYQKVFVNGNKSKRIQGTVSCIRVFRLKIVSSPVIGVENDCSDRFKCDGRFWAARGCASALRGRRFLAEAVAKATFVVRTNRDSPPPYRQVPSWYRKPLHTRVQRERQ